MKLFETGAEQLLATEVQVMKHLSGSEGILQLYDVMEDGVNLYMILELCRGKDVLREFLLAIPFETEDVRRDDADKLIMRQVTHNNRICHADSITSLKIDEGSTYSEAHAAALMHKMLEAVQQCHKKGVLHRDVKPENFLWTEVDGFGELKLADFGLSAMLDPKVWLMEPQRQSHTHDAVSVAYLSSIICSHCGS